MEKTLAEAVDGRSTNEQRATSENDEDTLVFEGETLAHSPRLGRRLVRWVSDRFDWGDAT